VARYTEPEDPSIQKLKRYDARKTPAMKKVQLDTSGEMRLKHSLRHLPVKHDEVGPAGGKKGLSPRKR
jgi:hypothetical protein